MPKYSGYSIITMHSAEALVECVEAVLPEGFEPIGGVTWAGGAFIQAVAKVDRSVETLVAEQINDIHTIMVVDIYTAIQNMREEMSYPRSVKVLT